ncbi:phage holin [Peribacillus butanolivorans]|uniref:phage holin n=1 Tax=Peribacillus butanolivorans TaxID=421767 RepID=UPI00366DF28B
MEKAKQYVAMVGGVLGALLLFFQALGFEISLFNEKTIDAFLNFLLAAVPLAFALYGVYKNQYLLTKKALEQEKTLEKQGLK